jgi:hypothetical protein
MVDDRHCYNNTALLRAELAGHMEVFFRTGGKIQYIPINVTSYNPDNAMQTFVINKHTVTPNPKKAQKNWKEHRHDKI